MRYNVKYHSGQPAVLIDVNYILIHIPASMIKQAGHISTYQIYKCHLIDKIIWECIRSPMIADISPPPLLDYPGMYPEPCDSQYPPPLTPLVYPYILYVTNIPCQGLRLGVHIGVRPGVCQGAPT